MSNPPDKGPEEKEVYPEMKHDSACSSQLQLSDMNTVPVGNGLCSPDLCISADSNSIVNGSVSKSSCAHVTDISEPTLCKPNSTDAVGLCTGNCTQDATETISGGNRNEAEAKVHRIATDQGKINCMTLPNVILMPPLVISKPETIKMDFESVKTNTELCPVESISVSQTYTTGISVVRENKVNATSSLISSVSFSQIAPTSVNELSEDVSASVSQPNLPSLSTGISALASNEATCGVFEPFLNQNLGLSSPSTAIFSHNMSTAKIDPFSDSSASETAWFHPQLSSSCSKIQNFGAVPKYVTCSTNMNNTFQGFAENTNFNFGVPLKSKQTIAAGISNVFSRPLASETSFIQGIPPKCSVSSDSCIWKNANKSSVTVLESFSRESSVFTGFKFCTLGSPISSSSIFKPLDASFQLGTPSSALDSGRVFKSGAPCTELAMAAAGTVGNTYLEPGFTVLGVNVGSNRVNTSGQETGCGITTSASAFVSFGKPSVPALTANSLSLPNTSAVSVGLFGKEPRIASATSSVFSTKVTTGFQFGMETSSLTGMGTKFSGFSPCSSKLGFGSHFESPKFEPLKDASLTKTAFANMFPVNSPGDFWSSSKASGSAAPGSHGSLLLSGSTEMKQNGCMNAFYGHSTFKAVPRLSPNNVNTTVISTGFSFGILSAAASSSELFSFTGSKEKSGCSSQLTLQRRSSSQRLRKFVLSILV
jgi:hypothetical protein